MRPAGAIVIGPIDAHGSARHSVLAVSHAGRHALFAECAVAVITVELIRLGIVGDKYIGPSVAVEIDDSNAERLAGGIAQAGLVGNVLEAAPAEVMEQLTRSSFVGFGGALRLDVAIERAPQIAFLGPLNVVGDEQIEFAVAVVIEPGRAGAET